MKIKSKWAAAVFIVLALVLAVGTALVAAPTEDAEAGSLSWTTVSTPTLGFLAVMPESSIDAIALASDGTTMYVGLNAGPTLGPLAPAQWMVARSTNAGLHWTNTSLNPGITVPIVDMAVAPDDPNFVVVTDGVIVWRTSDGGGTWQAVGTAATIATGAGAPAITSVDVGPLMSGEHPIVVGIDDVGVAIDANGVYIWGWGSPPSLSWSPQVLAEDTWAVALSPGYTSDFTVVAVGSPVGANTRVHLGSGLNAQAPANLNWDAAGAPVLYLGWPIVVDAGVVTSADIAFPDNWNGAMGGSQILLVGTAGGVAPDVYFVNTTAATALVSGVTGAYTIDFAGSTTGSHALIVGDTAAGAVPYANVRFTANISSAMAWGSPNKLPTGLTGMALVVFDPDYLTSGIAYTATGGAAGTIDENALSRSTDSCLSWNQVSLINTYMDGGMLDVTPSPDYANDNTLFLITGCTAAGPGGGFAAGSNYESLWIGSTAGMGAWERVDLRITANGVAIVRPSPEWATDGTVYWADTMVFMGAASTTIRRSTDGGGYFSAKTAFGNIADMAVENSTTLYVVSGMQVGKSSDGGSSWPTIGNALATLARIAREPNTGDLGVTGSGAIYLITDRTTMTPTPVGGIAGTGLGSVQFITFSHDYETTGALYLAEAGAVGGIWRSSVATGSQRIGVTVAALPAAGNAVGVVMGADGVLYAADGLAAPQVWRSVNPDATPVTLGTVPEFLAMTQGFAPLPIAAVIGQLKLASGNSNVLFVIETANDQVTLMGAILCGDRLMTYTDTLPLTPSLTSPSNGDSGVGTQVGALTGVVMYVATVEWSAVAGAVGYGIQIDTAADFTNPIVNIGVQNATWPASPDPLAIGANAPINAPATSYTTPGGPVALLNPGTEYFWRVRVDNTALGTMSAVGQWSSAWSFITGPGIAPSGLTLNAPEQGQTGVPLRPTFTWTSVAGMTAYDFQLASDAGFTSLVVDVSLGDQQSYITADDLEEETQYFWRVRAHDGTTTQWVTGGFTTEVPGEGTPVWVWIVIVIGAVLALVVIVLIVRTRRPV